jgi:hypothetical protein
VRVLPEHARADRVEGAGPHAARLVAEQPGDALAHLAGGLVGERDREDLRRVDLVVFDQAGDARREHARLPRPGAGEHEGRALVVEHRGALRGVEAVERVAAAGAGRARELEHAGAAGAGRGGRGVRHQAT